MKKIAILIGNITCSAGTERAVTNLSNILQKSGKVQVVIISHYSHKGEKCFYPLNSGVIIEHLEMSEKDFLGRIRETSMFLKNIEDVCNYYKIEAVIGTTHRYNILLSKIKSNIKKIGCEHINYASAPWYSKFLRRIAYPKLDAVVLLTKKDAEKYSFVKNSKVFVIPNSLSFTVENPAKLENKRIIAVGRLTKQKGWDYLVCASQKIKSAIPDWHIDIFGSGEDKESLLLQIKNCHVEDFITIKEPTPNIKDELLNSSVMVETSRWEGFPMVLVEAQACGLPLVGFDCPEGPSEIIKDGECGFLMQVGDIQKFSDCVIKLAKDKDFRKQMGNRSSELAKRFLPESIGKLWFSVFDLLFGCA